MSAESEAPPTLLPLLVQTFSKVCLAKYKVTNIPILFLAGVEASDEVDERRSIPYTEVFKKKTNYSCCQFFSVILSTSMLTSLILC